ncbi:MAG: phosphocholine cytidylyltransferase family protein [Rhodospirillales bacterium]|nr:phosphocholine cytidylyltransferase family protein [Rhodospirillales bacterium]
MRAIMLAAGMGNRLSGSNPKAPPKCLLSFGGKTLLQHHIEKLRGLGVAGLSLVIGYKSDEILTELENLQALDFVQSIHNSDYERGSILSLGCANDVLGWGEDILFMDADVLYPEHFLSRLIQPEKKNCFLFDGDFTPGDEPVKICLRQGEIVDFGKQVTEAHDAIGEWPGFLSLSANMAKALANIIGAYMERGEVDRPYEDALHDLITQNEPGTFGTVDISGNPWIEIDFPEDELRARSEILPRIEILEKH